MIARAVLVVTCAALWTGCGKNDVQVYRVPKEKPSSRVARTGEDPHAGMGVGAGMGMPALPKITHGPLPEGWTEVAASTMRVASFVIADKNDHRAELSVIPLPGMTGNDLDVVNLWRGNLKLAAIGTAELEKQLEPAIVGDIEAKLYDVSSAEPVLDQARKARILVAMFTRNNTSWFFKMTGDDELVRDQKKPFLEFLKAVKIDETTAVAPQISTSQIGPAGGGSSNMGSPSNSGRPKWTVPVGWREEPASTMLLAKFATGDAATGRADITVSVLGGAAGGALPNINRWRGQLQLAPIGDAQLGELAKPLDSKLPGAILVDMVSDSPKPGHTNRTRLLAAMVPQSSQTWFYKMMGDESGVARERDSFLKFVQTIEYPNAQ